MSELLRCDKCKCEIPEKTNEKKKLLGLLTEEWEEKHYVYMWNDDLWTTKTNSGKKHFHLCGNCMKKLNEWLEDD